MARTKTHKEVAALCSGCTREMFLSVEGFRCLRCPRVYCRKCAAGHFSELEHLVDAAVARQALRGGEGVTIAFMGPPPRSFTIEARESLKRLRRPPLLNLRRGVPLEELPRWISKRTEERQAALLRCPLGSSRKN